MARGHGVLPLGVPVHAEPSRAEPLYWIAMHYQHAKEFQLAKEFFQWAMSVPTPAPTGLFVERTIYDYLLELEYAVCCYYLAEHAEAVAINDQLLASGNLPAHLVEQVRANRKFSQDMLPKQVIPAGATIVWANHAQAAAAVVSIR